jgi:hypothetical protein
MFKNMTKQELDEIETELRKQLAFANSVMANTKDLDKQLEIIYLAKVGISAMLD